MGLRGRSGSLPPGYDGLCRPYSPAPSPQSSRFLYLAEVGARAGMLRSGAGQPRRQRTVPRRGHFGAPRVKFRGRAGTAPGQTPSLNEKVRSARQLREAGWLPRPAVRGSGGERLPRRRAAGPWRATPRGGDPGDAEETRHGSGADSGPAGG